MKMWSISFYFFLKEYCIFTSIGWFTLFFAIINCTSFLVYSAFQNIFFKNPPERQLEGLNDKTLLLGWASESQKYLWDCDLADL